MRPLLRLARGDARRHWRRTLLSVLLIALTAGGFVFVLGASQSTPPTREAALNTLPDEAQARLVATAVSRPGSPLTQLPEALPSQWIDDPQQAPFAAEDILSLLPAGNRLASFWDAPNLLVAVGLEGVPGQVVAAGEGAAALRETGLEHLARADLRELDAESLPLLLPDIVDGAAPGTPAEIAVSEALAQRLSLAPGQHVTTIAPPFTGWMSMEGRVAEVISGEQKTWLVTAIVAGAEERAYAPAGWVSALVEQDPAGVDRTYLVLGEAPVTWEAVRALNAEQVLGISRDAIVNYPPASQLYPVPFDAAQFLTHLATAIAIAVVGGALVLALATPAFAVAAEQQRRTLGVVSAVGGTSADLRRMITSQGLLVGVVGGLLGAALGTAGALILLAVLRPGTRIAAHFPWWSLPVAVLGAALLGWLVTLAPASWAARQEPIDALRGRASRRVAGRRVRGWAGVACLLVAGVAGAASLLLPVPEAPSRGQTPLLPGVLITVALLASALGAVLVIRPGLGLLARLRRGLPLAWRTAVRDADAHPSRIVPATAAVTIAVLASSFLLTLTASAIANEADSSLRMVGSDGLVFGVHVPISDEFDQAVMADATRRLARTLPVIGSEPVWSNDTRGNRWVLQAEVLHPCPEDFGPDTRSALEPGTPHTCVPWEKSWSPGFAMPSWLGDETFVMSADAVRASRRPDAEAAAQMLDSGGVLVSDLTRIRDGRVSVVEGTRTEEGFVVPTERYDLPGMFVPGFAGHLVLTPETARGLGWDDFALVGSIQVTSRSLYPWEVDAAFDQLHREAPLVWAGSATPAWGGSGMLGIIGFLVALGTGGTVISVLLARSQQSADLATLHALGAPRRFLRRVVASQAAVIVGLGVPIGLLVGLALGTFWVAWSRHLGTDGAWRRTVFLPEFQVATVVLVVLLAVAAGWIAGRPGRRLTIRRLD